MGGICGVDPVVIEIAEPLRGTAWGPYFLPRLLGHENEITCHLGASFSAWNVENLLQIGNSRLMHASWARTASDRLPKSAQAECSDDEDLHLLGTAPGTCQLFGVALIIPQVTKET